MQNKTSSKKFIIIVSSVIIVILICLVLYWCLLKDKNCDELMDDTSKQNIEKTYTDKVYPLKKNGINIHFDCMVEDNVKIEDNILLVHGLTYSSHEFDVDYMDYSLVRFLCDNGYAVWRIDIAGYGQSDKVKDGLKVNSSYAAKDIQCAIEEIIKITKTKTIDLFGWSWGTVTSALAEPKCCDMIDKYVMYAPILTGLGKSTIKDGHHKNTWENAASDFQVDKDGIIRNDITDSNVVDIFCSNCWRYDKDSSPNGGRKELCVDKSVKLIDLSKIKDTTLIICGDNDPYLNMKYVNSSLDNLLDDSELVIIKGGSHSVMMEKPYYHEFQEKLIKFLKK